LVGAALGLLLGVLFWLKPPPATDRRDQPPGSAEALTNPPPPDPRLAYAGPYRNVHPAVRYVGDAACAECHAAIAQTYHTHPMARSVVPIAAVAAAQHYGREYHNPLNALHSRFFIDRQGERVFHRQVRLGPAGQVLYEHTVEAHYAIGSGARGHSYLTFRDGSLFQTPISWFSQKQIWDLSPAFEALKLTSRPVDGQCLFCHANQARFRETSVNRFDASVLSGIGCERCHGPGELHVKEGGRRDRQSRADYTIVNPRRLEPALREAVCQQCHLEGAARVLRRGRHLYDFRPGLPLAAFWSVFVPADELSEGHKSVSHVEQMYQSACFRGSSGAAKLGCVSCHDPHAPLAAERRLAHYRERCLKCHGDHGCSAPAAVRQAKADSCIACHMPPYANADVAHTASTNHRIPRRPPGGEPGPAGEDLLLGSQVVSFYPEGAGQRDPELARDLGIGLSFLMVMGKLSPSLDNPRTVALLETALRRDPADVEAWQARARTYTLAKNPRQELAAYEAALKTSPEQESCLVGAAIAAQEIKEVDRALDYWRRAVALNPVMPTYRANLAALLTGRQAWTEARAECQACLRLDPENALGRRQWILCLLKDGAVQEAQRQLELLEALRPGDRDMLRAWFAEQTRRQRPAP
jgi:predicted CXXCH cytochrome family protein